LASRDTIPKKFWLACSPKVACIVSGDGHRVNQSWL
jgi:hypothetical protein